VPSADEIKTLRKHAQKFLVTDFGDLIQGDFDHAVATSKTFKQLARISGAAPSSEGQRVQRNLTLASLDEWVPKLTEMTVAQRAQLPGVSVGRAEQLIAGAIVAQETMKFFDLTSLEICPWALREGIILRRLDWFADDAE
jgi:exopolyphosphatase/guanosine-5'-triphosphate,3'-diphosphate pyrophosphatase